MAINEQVYGRRENWIVPTARTEQGTYISGISYDSTIAEINKIKIANYNTVDNPRTLMRTQMSGDLHSGGYAVNNEWLPTQTSTIDKSIAQFGIGPQSALSNIEWWGEVWASGETQPDTGSHDNVELINSDHYDVTNIAFAFGNTFRPSLYATSGSMAGNGYMNPANWQYLNRQLWGDSRCFYSSDVDVVPASAYALTSLITQIPIKNIKIYPVIRAYNSQMQSNEYRSIQDYIADKANYPFIYCIYAEFTTKVNSSTWASIDVSPWFFNSTSIAKGFGNGDIVRNENIMYLRTRDLSGGFFVIGGCPNFNSQSYYQTNGFYWHYNTSSVSFDVAELMPIYQPEDLKFEYDTAKNAFICDVSSMTNDQITKGIRKQLASFGMFFVDDIDDLNLALDDDKTFLGILKNGVGYGDYSSGDKNREQDQWNWNTMEENNYDPNTPPEPPDPNIYDTASQLNTPSRCASGTKYYVLNAAGVENLVGELWKAQESIPSDTSYMDFNNEQYLSNNPIDMIVSCKRYPLVPLKASESEPLVLGQYQTHVLGYVLSDTTTWINLGSKLIYKHFKNYLDYQTKIVLYIPFCGMINLDPSVWMGQTVNVYMAVDYITGSCTAYIIRDSDKVIYATAEGNCSVDLPVTGLQAATIEGQLLRSKSSLDSSKLMIGAKILGGVTAFAIAATTGGTGAAAAPAVIGGVTTIASTISDAYKINQLNYDLHHTDAPVQQIGSSSPLNAWSGELECRLYVYYPAVDPDTDDAAYAHSIGNATVQQGAIGSFGSTGEYAVFTNADLSDINCTDSEKTMISNALTSGVYL